MKVQLKFSTNDERWDYNYEYNCFSRHLDIGEAAEEFAQYYYDNYDGWDDTWPLTFYVGDENGRLLGKVKVDVDWSPSFSSVEVDHAPATSETEKPPIENQPVERQGKYWICSTCATLKSWYLPNPYGITCISGLCGWCDSNREETLIPVVDYSGPEGKKAIWD